MSCSCPNSQHFQPFPKTGSLAANLNRSLTAIRGEIGDDSHLLYAYIVTSVDYDGGSFVQKGSGPNFQGDVITLCTCKRYLRTFKSVDDWKNVWIAGFTGVAAGQGKNVLFYLMQVSDAFASFQELWYSRKLSEETEQAKAARTHCLGDLYQPRNARSDPYDEHGYWPPHQEHSHHPSGEWVQDICYRCFNRPSALLVGEPERSYLWDRPLIFHPARLHRGQKKYQSVGMLLEILTSYDHVNTL